jgi:hypothetical protein
MSDDRPEQPAAFYQWRAKEYRRMAEETADPHLANRLAVTFDEQAEKIERANDA